MFPLQHLSLPGSTLPLHVFEPRYVEMTRFCLDGDGLFGVVLIMRGSEVGADPGQVRSDVGVLTRIRRARPAAGERWMLETECLDRLRVHRWLPDDPYPRALIEVWPDPPAHEPTVRERIETVAAGFDRLLGILESQAVGTAPDRQEAIRREMLSGDPARASFQLCSAAPVGELDRLRLLAAVGTVERLELLDELLRDVEQTVRLIEDSNPPPPT